MTRLWVQRLFVLLLDIVFLEGLFYLTYLARFKSGLFANPVPFTATQVLVPSLIFLCYWLLLFTFFGLYRYDPLRPRSRIVAESLQAAGFGALLLFILTFEIDQPLPASRIILLSYGIGIVLIVSGTRVALSTILRELRIRGIGTWPTLVVGCGGAAAETSEYLARHPEIGFSIHGCLASEVKAIPAAAHLKLIGTFSQFREIVAARRFETVIFAPEPGEERQLFRLVRMLRGMQIRAFLSAGLYPMLIGQVRPAQLPGTRLIEVRPELLSLTERAFKRTFDLIAALLILLVTLPIWVVLIPLIPLDSPGPPFFVQRRVGRNGGVFPLIKFRSMVKGAEEETGAVLAVEKDVRVTRVGRIIRATRLDELPQLLNVILGQMSLVGPRPERVEFVRRFLREVPLYERRLNVKPGVTGWSQVHLRYDSSADQIPMKLKYDFYYIENMSLPLDLKILFMTLFVMLRGEGL